ncbi:MAG: hypothetical protein ACYTGJ_07485 [Planctomycetota bacterium]
MNRFDRSPADSSPHAGSRALPDWTCETAERFLSSPSFQGEGTIPTPLRQHLTRCSACRREAEEALRVGPLLRRALGPASLEGASTLDRRESALFRRGIRAAILQEPVPVRRLERRGFTGAAAAVLLFLGLSLLLLDFPRSALSPVETAESGDEGLSLLPDGEPSGTALFGGDSSSSMIEAASLRAAALRSVDFLSAPPPAIYSPARFIPSGQAPRGAAREVRF